MDPKESNKVGLLTPKNDSQLELTSWRIICKKKSQTYEISSLKCINIWGVIVHDALCILHGVRNNM